MEVTKSVNFLFKLLDRIWDDERIPTEWNKGLLVNYPRKETKAAVKTREV